MELRRVVFGIGGIVGPNAIVYARDSRRSTWTKAFPNSADVLQFAEVDWHADKVSWHYAPGDFEISELSTVYTSGTGQLIVSGEGAVTRSNLLSRNIDIVISLNEVKIDTLREINLAQREVPNIQHYRCPVRDLTPEYWGETDNKNAAFAAQKAHAAVREGRVVLVHCLMGIHRSPALATAVVQNLAGHAELHDAFLEVSSRRALAMWVPETARRFASCLRPASHPQRGQSTR